MDADPIASMRLWAIEVRLGERIFDIPALPAVDWWPVLSSGDPNLILDLIVSDPEDPENIDELILAGEIDGEQLAGALLDAIEEIAGRPFQAAVVLSAVADKRWADINGALVRRGFRWDMMPIAAALDAIYSLITEYMKAEDRTKFDALLSKPLPGSKRRPVDRDRAMNEFESIAGPKPKTGVRSTGAPSDSARPKTQPRPRQPRPTGR